MTYHFQQLFPRLEHCPSDEGLDRAPPVLEGLAVLVLVAVDAGAGVAVVGVVAGPRHVLCPPLGPVLRGLRHPNPPGQCAGGSEVDAPRDDLAQDEGHGPLGDGGGDDFGRHGEVLTGRAGRFGHSDVTHHLG